MASLGISIEDLPVLALSRPADTAPVAGRVLAATRDPYTRSYAAQALGVATRERGDVARALRHLRVALAAAASVGGEREADVQATLGITLAYAGRSGHALRHLDAALSQASGVAAARIRLRRGNVFQMVGRTGEAIEEHRRAARTLREDYPAGGCRIGRMDAKSAFSTSRPATS